jgi:hypothetical protein
MANFGKESSPQLIIPKVSQETLADMIGTTRSRVSHFMNKFRRLGFICPSSDSNRAGAAVVVRAGWPIVVPPASFQTF